MGVYTEERLFCCPVVFPQFDSLDNRLVHLTCHSLFSIVRVGSLFTSVSVLVSNIYALYLATAKMIVVLLECILCVLPSDNIEKGRSGSWFLAWSGTAFIERREQVTIHRSLRLRFVSDQRVASASAAEVIRS